MKRLRVPSAQHLARLWRPTAEQTSDALIQLALNPPTFTYVRLLRLIAGLVSLPVPLAQLKEAATRENSSYLEILELIFNEFSARRFDFALPVGARRYQLSRDLSVPFAPPMVCGADGQVIFPWFSLWRRNPLAGEPLSLFVSLVKEMLLQDPDLEDAHFEIWDFSSPDRDSQRQLRITSAEHVLPLTDKRKQEMLTIFVEGFQQAQSRLAGLQASLAASSQPSEQENNRSGDLFS